MSHVSENIINVDFSDKCHLCYSSVPWWIRRSPVRRYSWNSTKSVADFRKFVEDRHRFAEIWPKSVPFVKKCRRFAEIRSFLFLLSPLCVDHGRLLFVITEKSIIFRIIGALCRVSIAIYVNLIVGCIFVGEMGISIYSVISRFVSRDFRSDGITGEPGFQKYFWNSYGRISWMSQPQEHYVKWRWTYRINILYWMRNFPLPMLFYTRQYRTSTSGYTRVNLSVILNFGTRMVRYIFSIFLYGTDTWELILAYFEILRVKHCPLFKLCDFYIRLVPWQPALIYPFLRY